MLSVASYGSNGTVWHVINSSKRGWVQSTMWPSRTQKTYSALQSMLWRFESTIFGKPCSRAHVHVCVHVQSCQYNFYVHVHVNDHSMSMFMQPCRHWCGCQCHLCVCRCWYRLRVRCSVLPARPCCTQLESGRLLNHSLSQCVVRKCKHYITTFYINMWS